MTFKSDKASLFYFTKARAAKTKQVQLRAATIKSQQDRQFLEVIL
jgi:hypothetical protein